MKGSSRYELKDVIVGYDRTMNNSDNEYSGKLSTVDPPGTWSRIGVREKDFVTCPLRQANNNNKSNIYRGYHIAVIHLIKEYNQSAQKPVHNFSMERTRRINPLGLEDSFSNSYVHVHMGPKVLCQLHACID